MGDRIGTFQPDNLNAGGFPEIREYRTIPAGTVIKRGTILGNNGKPIVQGGVVDSIALEDVDASPVDTLCVAALTGEWNAGELITGDDTTANDWKADLRKLSIFVRHPAP